MSALQGDEVAAALTDESVCEAVPQLVRERGTNAGAFADALDHPPQRLLARRHLRILPPPFALVLRYPLLDLDGEDVVVELGLQLAEGCVEARPRRRGRAAASASAAPCGEHGPAAHQVEVSPPAAEDFRAPQPSALHEQDRRPLVRVVLPREYGRSSSRLGR